MFISILYMFRARMCSSSGDHLYHYDIWYMSLYVGDRLVCRFGWNLEIPLKPAYYSMQVTVWYVGLDGTWKFY